MSTGLPSAPDHARRPPRLRVATFDDYDGIVALESAAGMVSLSRDDWQGHWITNPVWPRVAGTWPIGWVLESEDGRVVGSVINIPALYLFQGRELVSANGRGWVVDPEYRGFAVSLMAEYFGRTDVDLFVNSTVGSNAVSTNLMFSRRVPAGDFSQAAYVEAAYRRRAAEALRRKGVPLASLLVKPAAALLYRRDVRSLRRRWPRTSGLRVVAISEFDERFDAFWTELVRSRPDVLQAVRDRATLAWHYTVSQRRGDLRILTAVSKGRLRGYCILRRERPAGRRSCLRLVDFQTLDAPEVVLPELLRAALRSCLDDDIDILEHFGCGLPKLAVFDSFAPHRRPWDSWPFYFRAVDEALDAQLADARHWDPSAYDGDFTLD